MTVFPIRRRSALQLMASAAIMPFAGLVAPARAFQAGIDFIVMADLHSAYERTGQLLAAVEDRVAASGNPSVIIINGDLFESGNIVASRSSGEIDWAFLEALAETAPVVFNIGNHEADIDNDLAHFVSRAQQLGITVLTNISDTRTGALYAPASASLDVDGKTVNFAALGVDNLFTYPKPTRDQLSIPEPVQWAKDNLADQLKDGEVNIVLSHAGVVPDKAILPMLPDGTLMIGGHDHLNIEHSDGDTRYLHTGCWSTACTVATIPAAGAPASFTRLDIDAEAPASERLAELIPAVMAAHLTADDTTVVGTTGKALSNDETGLFVAAAMAEAAGADIGFIGHTTFGAGLPQGSVSRYAFDSSVRFDGTLKQATVDAETLRQILERCNQFGDFPFDKRTGDYLYAAPAAEGKDTFVLVCNDWSATNAKNYFGRDDLTFSDIDDMNVKSVTLAAMK
ncbi:metallophosphoesterase [Martelella endophytica]|uniref:Serine/threonine protein phosphatase n=1 Tax=Martelella endophytica TaxID=1486262 RepID=A0A0D5LKJ5_MAREN|nr:metallophosphoesterase [Martelella endophytica]AJY44460.1 serine/threonine protein phosphatase [Martelella endophytica]